MLLRENFLLRLSWLVVDSGFGLDQKGLTGLLAMQESHRRRLCKRPSLQSRSRYQLAGCSRSSFGWLSSRSECCKDDNDDDDDDMQTARQVRMQSACCAFTFRCSSCCRPISGCWQVCGEEHCRLQRRRDDETDNAIRCLQIIECGCCGRTSRLRRFHGALCTRLGLVHLLQQASS